MIELITEERAQLGKAVKTLRNEGVIPVELYGHGIPNMHLAVKEKDFQKVFKTAGENTVITLLVGPKKHPVLIHDVQKDYLSSRIQHIDFYEIRMDEKIKVHIPIEFVGNASAVKEKGGNLNKAVNEIEVEVLPADMPHSFIADLSLLDDFGKSVYVRDLKVAKGVKILTDLEMAIATVSAPIEEKVEETPVTVEDVKVETEEKKAERAAGKTEGEKEE